MDRAPYCLTMIYESSKTISSLMPKSIAFLIPWTSASYSVVLLVHSKSNLQDKQLCFPTGLMKMHHTLAPS
jgi:hypothetical protein